MIDAPPRQVNGPPSLRYAPYPAYKESGVEWLGEIPAHWETKRLRYVAPVTDERCHTVTSELPYIGLENIESGTGRLARSFEATGPEGEDAEGTASLFRLGDVLFGKLRPYLAKVLRPEFEGRCSTELLVLRSTADIEPSFLAYQILSRDFIGWVDAMTYGTKMPRASSDQVMGIPVALAPAQEQRAIAAFLDRETARIDELMAKKERVLELLEEQRTALISQAVTKGLDSNVPMKNSGVEWLGEIPAGWAVAPVYSRYEVALGKMLDAKRVTGEFSGRYLRNVDVQWDAVNTEGLPEMDFAPTERDRYLVRAGDLLVCEGGEVGRTAVWRGEIDECFYQKAIHRVRPRAQSEEPRFLFYLLYMLSKRGVLIAGGNQNTIDHLTAVQLRHYRLPFAPLEEQRAIAAYLDRETARIDALVAKVHDAIDRLRELRTALISATVTGKIDVRGEAA